MSRLIAALDSILKNTLIVLMGLIVVVVLWQVLSRYVVQSPSTVSEELARFLLIWISLIGGVYAYRQKLHLGLDIWVRKMTGPNKFYASFFCYLAILLFSITVLLLGGSQLVLRTLNPIQVSAILGVKVAYIYLALPLSGLFMSIYTIDDLINAWRQYRSKQSVGAS